MNPTELLDRCFQSTSEGEVGAGSKFRRMFDETTLEWRSTFNSLLNAMEQDGSGAEAVDWP